MRRTILIVMSLLMSVVCMAQKISTKEFDRYLEKYDRLKDCLEMQSSYGKSFYWDIARKTNESFSMLYTDLDRKKRKTIIDYYKEACDYASQYDSFPDFHDYRDIEIDIIPFLENGSLTKHISGIHVYEAKDKNAFACPEGTICVSSSIVNEYDSMELLGILAHEMAHFVLEHGLQKRLSDIKKDKKYRRWAVLSVVANSVLSASVHAKGGVKQEDSDDYWSDVQRNNQLLMNMFDYRGELSKFKYSREKEIEADILAYRFMEFMGLDPASYINALCKLVGFSNNPDDPNYQRDRKSFISYFYDDDKESDHPSLSYRYCLLEYIKEYDKRKSVK